MKSILDADFKYTPSFDTDLRKKFEAVKDKMKAEQERSEAIAKEAERVVAKIKIKGKS